MFKYFTVFLVLLTASLAQADVVPWGGKRQPVKSCTEMWCQEGLMLQLQGADWPAGEYEFVIGMDGMVTRCKGSLPFKTCDGTVTCDKKNVTIGESGCALPEGHSFHAVMSQETPDNLSVIIKRSDGKTFAYQSPVKKQCGYPNGKECDPHECCSAVMETQIEWK